MDSTSKPYSTGAWKDKSLVPGIADLKADPPAAPGADAAVPPAPGPVTPPAPDATTTPAPGPATPPAADAPPPATEGTPKP